MAFVLSYKALPGMGYLPTGGTNLIKVQMATAEGTSLEENSRLMNILEERWKRIKGVKKSHRGSQPTGQPECDFSCL